MRGRGGLALVVLLLQGSCSKPAAPARTALANADLGTGDGSASGPAIGGPCKPEDGWQYTYPPGWPTTDSPVVDDGGAPTAVPIPPNYMEAHQLAPGVRYCVTRLPAYPDGFFTSNCKTDGDCPSEARCDGSWCNRSCANDGDCRVGLYCPSTTSGARFCRQGCPLSQPMNGDGSCYTYGGPWLCAYPSAGGQTVCRCTLMDLNTATWACSAAP
jgi:hypothetical protein